MELKDNPLLQPEDYLEGYRTSVERLKNNPQLLMFDRLSYEVFNTEMGKKWMEYVMEYYFFPALSHRDTATYQITVIWEQGFKDFIRMVKNAMKNHEHRIKAETNNNVR